MSRAAGTTTALIAVAWAATGLLVGHALTYALLFPQAHRHAVVLAESGHGWVDWLWPLTLASGLGAVVIGLLSGTSRGGSRGIRFLALATVQVALFAGLELSERAMGGLSLSSLQHELFGHGLGGILVVGSLVQLVAAWFGSAASRLVRRVAAGLRRPSSRPRATRHSVLRATSVRRVGRVDVAQAIRGPPPVGIVPAPLASADGIAR